MGTNIMHVCNSVIPAFVRRCKDSSAFMRTWGPSGQALDVVPFSTIKLHKTEAWKQMGTLQVGIHYAPEKKNGLKIKVCLLLTTMTEIRKKHTCPGLL